MSNWRIISTKRREYDDNCSCEEIRKSSKLNRLKYSDPWKMMLYHTGNCLAWDSENTWVNDTTGEVLSLRQGSTP